jgi:hypothetical protein
MTYFTKIDHWIGKTLFIPAIVKICHKTGWSQFALSRFFILLAVLDGSYRALTVFAPLALIYALVSISLMREAVSCVDHPMSSPLTCRLAALGCLIGTLALAAETGIWIADCPMLVLIALYASTIRTLPPEPLSKRDAALAKATAIR